MTSEDDEEQLLPGSLMTVQSAFVYGSVDAFTSGSSGNPRWAVYGQVALVISTVNVMRQSFDLENTIPRKAVLVLMNGRLCWVMHNMLWRVH